MSTVEQRTDPSPETGLARRPDGVSDETVRAAGSVTEALEWIERARGVLYEFHQLIGHADLLLGEAAENLRDAGHADLANTLESEYVGRNILAGRWTFQIVEEFDDGYWTSIREFDRQVRDELMGGKRHVFEAEMKQDRRSDGRPGHEASPDSL